MKRKKRCNEVSRVSADKMETRWSECQEHDLTSPCFAVFVSAVGY